MRIIPNSYGKGKKTPQVKLFKSTHYWNCNEKKLIFYQYAGWFTCTKRWWQILHEILSESIDNEASAAVPFY